MGVDFGVSGPCATGSSHPYRDAAQSGHGIYAARVLDRPLVYISEVRGDSGVLEEDHGRYWPEKRRALGSTGGRREPIGFLDDAARVGREVGSLGYRRSAAAC